MSEKDKKSVNFVLLPDGSIRSATEEGADIGDIWATQQFIREQEAQEELLLKQEPMIKKSKRFFKKAQKKAHSPVVAAKPVAGTQAVNAPLPRLQWVTYQLAGTQDTSVPLPPLQWATYHFQDNAEPEGAILAQSPAPKEITISLTVPKLKTLKLPKTHAKKAIKKLKTIPLWAYAVVALFVLPALMITLSAINRHNPTKKGSVAGAQAAAVADYKTLAPDGDVTNTTSQKITYDPKRKVSSFTDKINGYEVTVSMQPIPSNFKPAIGENVKKVAEQFAANTVLTVDNGAAYLGTSAKGPQSFVGYRGDLLVFMTSKQKIADAAWASYFNTLK
jgi:hypothetical protein